LARAAGGLIISTSANISGEPPPGRPEAIAKDLLRSAEAFLDSGELPGSLPSTIVDVTVHPAALIRAGMVSWDDVRQALQTKVPGAGIDCGSGTKFELLNQ
jgi:L-threonylcarbamoyladenylate synthase